MPPPLAVPQLGPCALSGRAWRLWAARHSQEEADPLGAQPPPRVLAPAASKAADSTAFDHAGRLSMLTSLTLDSNQLKALPDELSNRNPNPNQGSPVCA